MTHWLLELNEGSLTRNIEGTTEWKQTDWSFTHRLLTNCCLNSLIQRELTQLVFCNLDFHNLRYADDTTLMAESEELQSFMMKVKAESEIVGLKLNIQKTKITASGPITSWQIDAETVTDFILGDSKITADDDCSREIKRCSLLGRKVMTNRHSLSKSRDITLPTKVCVVKAMVFPVVMYECESCTIKKTEHWRIYAFELWCSWRLLRVPWTSRRSNQSILKEISPEYSLEGLMLKLKLQYFGQLMWRTDSLEKTLMLGKIEGRRTRGQQRMRWLDGITNSMDMSFVNSGSWWWTSRPVMLQSMGSQRVGQDWATEMTDWIFSAIMSLGSGVKVLQIVSQP